MISRLNLLILSLVMALALAPAARADRAVSVLVGTVLLHRQTVPARLAAYGSIMAGPAAQTSLRLKADGVVARIPVVPGERVAAGQVLADIAPDAASIAALRRARDALMAARAARAHVAALLATHLATAADLAAATQTLDDAKANLRALRATGAGQARAMKAPFAGVVSAIVAAQGASLAAGAPVLTLLNPARVTAQLGVTPAQAARIAPGNDARLTLLATNISLDAKVSAVAALRDPQTGLVDITLALAKPAPVGAAVKGEITTGTRIGYEVPRDAVQSDETGDYVFQVGPGNIAQRQMVKILGSEGAQTILAPTLNPALQLVTSGAYQLENGMHVRLKTVLAKGRE